jgi:hypothetical protein
VRRPKAGGRCSTATPEWLRDLRQRAADDAGNEGGAGRRAINSSQIVTS